MRLPVLDTVSTISLYFVIFSHLVPHMNSNLWNWQILDEEAVSFIIAQGGRFSVPFFFLSVGYYYGKALQRGADPFTFLILYGRKLLYVYISWNLIYAIIPPNFFHVFSKFGIFSSIYIQLQCTWDWLINNNISVILLGTKRHLWFIMACITGLAITSCFCKYNIARFLVPFGIVLYLIGLLGDSYSRTPIGLSLPFDTQVLLYSTIFIGVGRRLSMYHENNKSLALSFFFGGALMHFAEIYYLKRMYDLDALGHNFLLGTMFWGVGAFLLCLEYPNVGRNSFLEKIGKFTLGIYVSHALIIDALIPTSGLVKSLAWDLFKPVFVLLLSYGLCQGLTRNRILAKILT